MRKLLYVSIVLVSILLLPSCKTTFGSQKTYDKNRTLIREGRVDLVDIHSYEKDYEDDVLYEMDCGVVDYYKRNFQAAVNSLEMASESMEQLYEKGQKSGVKTYITNDLSRTYGGEAYEVIFANIFAAMGYAQMGNLEEALVEVKQSDIKLTNYQLNEKEEEGKLTKLALAINSNPYQWLSDRYEARPYTASPTADYISMITYRATGDSGNAEVDMRRLQEKGLAVDADDTEVPEGKARVNVISLNGLIGKKVAHYARSEHIFGDITLRPILVPYTVSWPVMTDGECSVVSATVSVSNGETFELSMLEDVTDSARKCVNTDVRKTYLRSWYRGYLKIAALAVVRDVSVKGALDSDASDLGKAFAIAAANTTFWVGVAATNRAEVADTRMAMYLPDNITCGGITLEPGIYDFTVTYHLKNGSTYVVSYPGYEVRENTLNLLTPQCPR